MAFSRPTPNGSELFVRSAEEYEGILTIGNAEGAERRDVERVADVGETVQTRRPPDSESRSGDRKADRQGERDPPQLAEPFAYQLEGLLRRTTHRRGCGTLVLDAHERVVSRRSKIRSLTFRPS